MATRKRAEARLFDLARFLPHRLSALSRLTQDLLASTLAESEVTTAQWRVYLCLATRGPSHLNGIAEFTHLPQSSLSRSVARMHERGLVKNARDDTDRRIARIEITPKGRRHLARLTAAMEATCAAAFRMSPAEEAKFLGTIDELIARLSGWRTDAPGAQASQPARRGALRRYGGTAPEEPAG